MKKSAEPNSDKMKMEFRRQLENYKAAPSENLWDKIELGLDKEAALTYKNRMRNYARLAAAFVVLLFMVGLVLVTKRLPQFNTPDPAIPATETSAIDVPDPGTEITAGRMSAPVQAPAAPVAQNAPEKVDARKQQSLPETTPAAEKTVGFTPQKVASAPVNQAGVLKTKRIPKAGLIAIAAGIKGSAKNVIKTNGTAGNSKPITSSNAAGNVADATVTRTAASQTNEIIEAQPATAANQQPASVETPNAPETVLAQTKATAVPQDSVKAPVQAPAAIAANTTEEELEAPEKMYRWSVAANYSAVHFNSGIRLAPKQLTDNGVNSKEIAGYESAIKEFNQETTSAYSLVSGIGLGFKLTNNWMVQTGMNYARFREQTISSYVFNRDPNGGSGATNGQTQTTIQTVLGEEFDPNSTFVIPVTAYTTLYSYEYVSVPVSIRFQTDKPEFYYFGAAGLTFNWLTDASIEKVEGSKANISAITQDINRAQNGLFRNSLMSVQLQSGLGYHISSRWHGEFGVTGNQFLRSLVKDEKAAGTKQRKPVNIGATFSLGYSF